MKQLFITILTVFLSTSLWARVPDGPDDCEAGSRDPNCKAGLATVELADHITGPLIKGFGALASGTDAAEEVDQLAADGATTGVFEAPVFDGVSQPSNSGSGQDTGI